MGGMIQTKLLMDVFQLKDFLKTLQLSIDQNNNQIDPMTLVESFCVSVRIGCYWFRQIAMVPWVQRIHEICNWSRVPSGTTFHCFFRKFNIDENQQVFEAFGTRFFFLFQFDNLTGYEDCGIITRDGCQHGCR